MLRYVAARVSVRKRAKESAARELRRIAAGDAVTQATTTTTTNEAKQQTKRNEVNKARRTASEVRREERKTLNDCMHD